MMEWEGVVAAIIFLGGCNFRCLYCHNYDIAFGNDEGEVISEEAVFTRLTELRGWIDGVVISGGEPTIYGAELINLLKKIRQKGLKTKLYTNGTNPELLQKIINDRLIDAVSMDIKHTIEKYGDVVMVQSKDVVRNVEDAIDILKNRNDMQVKFRLTVVKGVHTAQDICEIRRLVYPKPLVLQNVSPEHVPAGSSRLVQPFSAREFEELQKIVC